MKKYFHPIFTTNDIIEQIKLAIREDRSAKLVAKDKKSYKALLKDLICIIDDIDYSESKDSPTDVWGKLDGKDFRIHLTYEE